MIGPRHRMISQDPAEAAEQNAENWRDTAQTFDELEANILLAQTAADEASESAENAQASADASQGSADAALAAVVVAEAAADAAQAAADAAQATADDSALLWEWNGTDTSQFESTSVVRTLMTSTDASFLTVVADNDALYGNVLRLNASSNTASPFGHCIRLISQTFPLKYRIEFEFKLVSTSTGSPFWGLAVMGDNTSGFYAYVPAANNSGFGKYRVDNGTPTAFDGTADGGGAWRTDAAADQWADLRIQGYKRSGVPVKFSTRSERRRTNQSTSVFGRNANWTGEPAGAGWNNLANNRIGFAYRANANPSALIIDFVYIRVFADG